MKTYLFLPYSVSEKKSVDIFHENILACMHASMFP